jgi:hypothetical protein
MHSDVICTHSAMNVLSTEIRNYDGLRDSVRKLHTGYVNRQQRPVDQSYDEIAGHGRAEAYGSVHLYRLRDLPILWERFGKPTRQFMVYNQIRHPLSLVWSGYGEFQTLFRFDINELHWTLGKLLDTSRDFVFDLARRYDLMLGDYEVLAFLCACRVLGSLRLDIDAEAVVRQLPGADFRGHVQMEQITSDPERFSAVFSGATGLPVAVDDAYVQEVFATKAINKHRQDTKRLTPRQRWETLKDWQEDAFCHFLERFDLLPFYTEQGYEFDFIQACVA